MPDYAEIPLSTEGNTLGIYPEIIESLVRDRGGDTERVLRVWVMVLFVAMENRVLARRKDEPAPSHFG